MLFEAEELKERLLREMQLGLEELDRGEGLAGENVLAEINTRLDSRHTR